jgi:hypothetical protein
MPKGQFITQGITQTFNTDYVKMPFRPTLDDTHDAAPLSS